MESLLADLYEQYRNEKEAAQSVSDEIEKLVEKEIKHIRRCNEITAQIEACKRRFANA